MKNTFKLSSPLKALVPMGMVVALALTGCGSGGSSSAGGTEQKTITIGTSNDAPFSFTDQGTGALKGIDGEMINAIAANKGWKIKVFTSEYATLIAALSAKKADVIVDAMYITDERKKKINFTDPWYTEGEAMVVPGDSTLTSRDDVKGKVLGAQTGTVFKDLVDSLGGKQVKLFDSQAALLAAVENKQVDAVFTDSAVIAYSLVQKPNPKLKLVSPYKPYYPGIIGAGVRKDDMQLLKDLNSGLADLKKTPKYMEILKKYGLGEANSSK
ncbi:amino acid ABC transporter substrate-binding protein [Paenarthrobacter sp. Z7-10]|uniref:ABC transporter substrate-binding protein n=1 Tax=Paenarthrobacter sp. Z7-10 TaxID=2787635 RepID=UPI0022A9568B|nr:ABC transporter substrate-binding protein [Paenarthrobacter sp. Z7-10]MCZ2403465.1 amino acid ABC transporter substrate-binding protein [Paenarthrobacter sp. Z7-10]